MVIIGIIFWGFIIVSVVYSLYSMIKDDPPSLNTYLDTHKGKINWDRYRLEKLVYGYSYAEMCRRLRTGMYEYGPDEDPNHHVSLRQIIKEKSEGGRPTR